MAIISFENKFIFIKTRKVAGTSIEAYLRKFTGPDDIVTAMTPRDEYSLVSQGLFPRNFAQDPKDERFYIDLILAEKFEEALYFLSNVKLKFYSHMRALVIKNILKKENKTYNNFFKFTIERHPYQWLISVAAYNNKQYNQQGHFDCSNRLGMLTKKIKLWLTNPKNTAQLNWRLYTDNKGNPLVNSVMKYEQLNEEFGRVLAKLNLPFKQELPQLKINPHLLNANDIIDEELKNLIYLKFKHVVDFMGYDL